MTQLDMLGGQDAGMSVMLDIQNLYDQFAGMVIVNDWNRTGCFRVLHPFFFDQYVADQTTNSFGMVCILNIF